MNRRRFLAGAAAAASTSLWPDFLRRAFAEEECADDGLAALASVSAAVRLAQRSGKPLLVLVIPKDDAAKYERGHAFGELLNHGGDEALAALALVEVVCAPTAALRKLVPSASGEPLMFLIDPSRVPATVRPLDATLPSYWQRIRREEKEKQDKEPSDDEIIERRIALLTRLLAVDAGLRDQATLTALGSRVVSALPGAQLAEVERVIPAMTTPPLSLIDRGAALFAVHSLGEGRGPAQWRALLASAARARLTGVPPAGARWANSYGCGTNVEGDEPVMMGCGMGHVPTKSQRFLYLFAMTPAEERASRRREQQQKKKAP